MKKTKQSKKAPVHIPPPPLPPANTCGTEAPREFRPEPSFAAKLTTRIERQLREIDECRDRISHHERGLAEAKNDLSTVLLNHQQTNHELEKALAVPQIAH